MTPDYHTPSTITVLDETAEDQLTQLSAPQQDPQAFTAVGVAPIQSWETANAVLPDIGDVDAKLLAAAGKSNTIVVSTTTKAVLETITVNIGENGNWFVGGSDTGIAASGTSPEFMARLGGFYQSPPMVYVPATKALTIQPGGIYVARSEEEQKYYQNTVTTEITGVVADDTVAICVDYMGNLSQHTTLNLPEINDTLALLAVVEDGEPRNIQVNELMVRAANSATDAAASALSAKQDRELGEQAAQTATTKAGKAAASAATASDSETVTTQLHAATQVLHDTVVAADSRVANSELVIEGYKNSSEAAALAASLSKDDAAGSATSAASDAATVAILKSQTDANAIATAADAVSASNSADRAEAEADRAGEYASAVANGVIFKGDWDASNGQFPVPTLAPEKADQYIISVAGTMTGAGAQPTVTVKVGDTLMWHTEKDIWIRIAVSSSHNHDDRYPKIAGGSVMQGDLTFVTSKKIKFGGTDFYHYSNGNTYIDQQNSTGHVFLQNRAVDGVVALMAMEGEASLLRRCVAALSENDEAYGAIYHGGLQRVRGTDYGAYVNGMLIASDKVSVNGEKLALTTNDGYGNANVTFNHSKGVPSQDGMSGRIEVNTDSTTGDASMTFGLSAGMQQGVVADVTTVVAFLRTETGQNQLLLPSGNIKLDGADADIVFTGSDPHEIRTDGSDAPAIRLSSDNQGGNLLLSSGSNGAVYLRPDGLDSAASEVSIGSSIMSVKGMYLNMNNNDIKNVTSLQLTNYETSTPTQTQGTVIYDANYYEDGELDETAIRWGTNGGGLAILDEDGWAGHLSSTNASNADVRLSTLALGGASIGFASNNVLLALGDADTGLGQGGDGILTFWTNNNKRAEFSANGHLTLWHQLNIENGADIVFNNNGSTTQIRSSDPAKPEQGLQFGTGGATYIAGDGSEDTGGGVYIRPRGFSTSTYQTFFDSVGGDVTMPTDLSIGNNISSNNSVLNIQGNRSTLTNPIGDLRFTNTHTDEVFRIQMDGQGDLRFMDGIDLRLDNGSVLFSRNVADNASVNLIGLTSNERVQIAGTGGYGTELNGRAANQLRVVGSPTTNAHLRFYGADDVGRALLYSSNVGNFNIRVGVDGNTQHTHYFDSDGDVRLAANLDVNNQAQVGSLVVEGTATAERLMLDTNDNATSPQLIIGDSGGGEALIGAVSFFTNDGGGNSGIRFNNDPTQGVNVALEDGSAWEMETSNDSTNGDLVFYADPDVTAGETITWTEILRLRPDTRDLVIGGSTHADFVVGRGHNNDGRWVRWKSGFQEVWGSVLASGASTTVNYPIAFKNGADLTRQPIANEADICLTITPIDKDAVNVSAGSGGSIGPNNNSYFTVYTENDTSAGAHYYACGYWQ